MRRLMTLGLLFWLCLVGGRGEAEAQTPVTPSQFVAFDQSDYGAVTRFEIRVDAVAWVDVGRPAATGAANTVRFPVPAMTPGPHALTLRACNAAGCSAPSTPVNVTMVAIPSVPTNGRIVDAVP